MANIVDYLKWRGDILLDNCPFNDVDNLVLSLSFPTLALMASFPPSAPTKPYCSQMHVKK